MSGEHSNTPAPPSKETELDEIRRRLEHAMSEVTALRAEVERLRLLLRPYCKHQGDLYDGHLCMDCGLSPASPEST